MKGYEEVRHPSPRKDYKTESEYIKSYKIVIDSLKQQLAEKDKLLQQFQSQYDNHKITHKTTPREY